MNFAHPAFAPYQEFAHLFGHDDRLSQLNSLAERAQIVHAHTGLPVRFLDEPAPASAAQYELGIASTACVPTREHSLHDGFNALVWLRFPRIKSALNQRHADILRAHPAEHRQRGKLRDQLTLLDESGVLVLSSRAESLEQLRQRRWVELLWKQRQHVASTMQVYVVGHGLLEKCLHPFAGMTGKCLLIEVQSLPASLAEVDGLAAQAILGLTPDTLPPLPIQGLPGWSDGQCEAFYQDTCVFRPISGI